MTDNRTYPISVFVNNLKGQFRYSPLNFRLTGGLNILIAAGLVPVIICYNLSRWFKSQTRLVGSSLVGSSLRLEPTVESGQYPAILRCP